MRRQEVEYWALNIIESVQNSDAIEDGRVELKADFIDAVKAARRIAGHANAARGESILWIIGIDEKNGINNISGTDLAEWWPKVQSHFDSHVPGLQDFVLNVDGTPIYLLHFDTSEAPFVIKNPKFGTRNGGSVEREVPWREGTKVRSATREDLIKLLLPTVSLPDVEVLETNVTVQKKEGIDPSFSPQDDEIKKEPHLEWVFRITFYITPKTNETIVFPIHNTQLKFSVNTISSDNCSIAKLRYSRPTIYGGHNSRPDSASIETTSSEALIHLPGKLYLNGYYYEPEREFDNTKKSMDLTFSVIPSGLDRSIVKRIKLIPDPDENHYMARWYFNKYD